MCKKVFIFENGELGLEGSDNNKIASSYDLIEELCMGMQPYLGLLKLSDGLFLWQDNFDDIESIEDIGMVCEYVKICDVFPEAIPIKIERKKRSIRNLVNNNMFVACLIVGVVFLHIFFYIFKLGMMG